MSPDSSRSLKLSNTRLHVLLPLYVAVLRFQFLDCSYSERCTTKKVVNTAFSAGSVPLASQMNTFTLFIDDVAFVVLVYTGGYLSDVWLQLNNLLCSKATSYWSRENICEELAENTSLWHVPVPHLFHVEAKESPRSRRFYNIVLMWHPWIRVYLWLQSHYWLC